MDIDCCHLSFSFLICGLVGIITGFKWLGSISEQGDKKVAERLQAYCMYPYVCVCVFEWNFCHVIAEAEGQRL